MIVFWAVTCILSSLNMRVDGFLILCGGRNEAGAVFVVERVIINVAIFQTNPRFELNPARQLIGEIKSHECGFVFPPIKTGWQRDNFASIGPLTVANPGVCRDLACCGPLRRQVEFIEHIITGGCLLKAFQCAPVAKCQAAIATVGIVVIEISNDARVVAVKKVIVLTVEIFEPTAKLAFAGEAPVELKTIVVLGKAVVVLVDAIKLAL